MSSKVTVIFLIQLSSVKSTSSGLKAFCCHVPMQQLQLPAGKQERLGLKPAITEQVTQNFFHFPSYQGKLLLLPSAAEGISPSGLPLRQHHGHIPGERCLACLGCWWHVAWPGTGSRAPGSSSFSQEGLTQQCSMTFMGLVGCAGGDMHGSVEDVPAW